MFKRTVSLLLCVLMCISSLQLFAGAEAAVTTEGDAKVAYVSPSGSVTYNGSTYEAFANLNDAIAALGTDGGIIRFSGVLLLNETGSSFITDIEGRGPLTIEGIGSDISANVLEFFNRYSSLAILGDTTFNNLTFKVVAGKELPFRAQGHTLTIGENVAVTRTVPEGVSDDKRMLHVYGTASVEGAPADTVILNGGTYTNNALGSYWDPKGGKKIIGDPSTTINGGTFSTIFGGFSNAVALDPSAFNVMEGSPKITINGGQFNGPIYAGSSKSDKITGNSVIEINGGSFTNFLVAGNSQATSIIEGNAAVIVNGGDLSGTTLGNTGKGFLNGKDIYIINDPSSGASFNSASEAAYRIKVIGGKVYPKFNGTALEGFEISSPNAIGALEVYLNGELINPISGNLYSIPEGESNISIGYSGTLSIKDDLGAFIKGYEDETFKPQNNMTRAEAVTTILRLIANESEIAGKFTSSFSDIEKGTWYYDNIAMFEAVGYLSGYSGELKPNQNITRAEFVELIYNVIGSKNLVLTSFSDVPSDHERFFAISAAASAGLVTGYPDGTFNPDGEITRAEVVTVIDRLLKREPTGNDGLNTFSDISDHWAKNNIISASNDSIQTIDGAQVIIWNKAAEAPITEFVIPEGAKTADQMLKALNSIKSSISADSYLAGIDKIAEQMKTNVINSKSEYTIKGTVYYVSNNGDDSNDGKSPDKPVKTLTKMTWLGLQPGDVVLFERGGEWRGKFSTSEGVTYSAYGEGPKPIINGSSKNYADPLLWTETDVKNVYVLSDTVVNVGFLAFDHTRENGKYDEVLSKMRTAGLDTFKTYADLSSDLEHYSDLSTNKLYLYSDKGNPGERFKSIEVAQSTHVISVVNDSVTLDNLHLMYSGSHGAGAGTRKDFTVQNCIIDWIGGSILKGFNGGNLVRYGNAIEVYGGCKNYTVQNNWIYQIYDTGVTHQYNGLSEGNCHMDGVNYLNNLIEYCYWSIEFYNGKHEETSRSVKNVHMKGNFLHYGGYGWGCVGRESSAPLISGGGMTDDVENCIAEENILYQCSGRLIFLGPDPGNKKFIMKNNTYIQPIYATLGYIFGRTYSFDKNALKNLKELVGEENPTLVYLENKK